MSEIPKAYEPQAVEERWYQYWLDQRLFAADPARVSSTRPAYSIVIPPPNVTGVLTLGHVLNNTIQDILARKARMDGKEVLWQPGIDHAGIATQTVVERALKKEGVIRHRDDLGREKFLEKVWEWKEKHGDIILRQLKKLGASCDWDRLRFTMDDDYSRCVQRVFVDLFAKDLIYRGKRMVNWCPASLTALSDEEVVMKETKGSLYYFKVEVAEAPGVFLSIATTRPETIPGDTGVAVNPEDPRYASLIGKHVIRPLPSELPAELKHIPIVGDSAVDFKFGTGVLKVTPAHDRTDFEIGLRHSLPAVDIMNPNGTMNERAGNDLVGLDRFKARTAAVEKLKTLGSFEKEEPHVNNVGFSERADVAIEPRLSEQWFLRYPRQGEARAVVAEGRMRFFPERWAKVYDHWMSNLQDWCISRQLWWGHRIPVWMPPIGWNSTENLPPLLTFLDSLKAAGRNDFAVRHSPIADSSATAPAGSATSRYPIEVSVRAEGADLIAQLEALGLLQDPDVLDTWFSSWLWPFATMYWTGEPQKDANNALLNTFYPTSDLVTGPDIIFFWVARMIIAGFEYRGDLPFQHVYFTGIIRDKQGRKLSKSLGNSPDPLKLIDAYGADALRFGTMRAAPLGQDILFDEQQVELGRNFCNKLWNACRFRQMQGGEIEAEIDANLLTVDDRWILIRLDEAIAEVTGALKEYKFNEATSSLYRFFWSEFCDWYLEASKAALTQSQSTETVNHNGQPATTPRTSRDNKIAVIDFILSNTLRLFHPFLPFITEELWNDLGYRTDLPADRGGKTILQSTWPKQFTAAEKEYFGLDDSVDRLATATYELVSQGRNLRARFNIPSGRRVPYILRPAGKIDPLQVEVIRALLNAERLEIVDIYTPPQGTPVASNDLGQLYMPLAGAVELTAEKARLDKELEKIRTEIAKVQQKLANPSFIQKVPQEVLAEHRQRLADWQGKERQALESKASLPSTG